MSSPLTALVLLQSIKNRPLEATLLRQFMELGILFELIEVSAKYPSPLPPSSEIACILSEPSEICQKFAHAHYPNIPLVLIPPTASTHSQSLEILENSANSLSGAPTLALGKAGETNAALFAASIIALHDHALRKRLHAFRKNQTATVLKAELPAI